MHSAQAVAPNTMIFLCRTPSHVHLTIVFLILPVHSQVGATELTRCCTPWSARHIRPCPLPGCVKQLCRCALQMFAIHFKGAFRFWPHLQDVFVVIHVVFFFAVNACNKKTVTPCIFFLR